MTLGCGIAEVDGKHVYWLRYLDWCCTTPLMLIELGILAGSDKWTTAILIVFDELMVITGMMAALSPEGKWELFMIGMVAFVLVLAKLFGNLQKKAQELGGEPEMLFNFVAGRTMEIWCTYPALFALCECANSFPEEFEVSGYAIADVLAKCGIPMMVWVSSLNNGKRPLLPTLLTSEVNN
eukprot:gb/GFBE01020569.1/.p1 GENE.gb/GFBE01020569.1/~~gb/GFBE01020569.1/.p1  ORF type:complete len:181 (+),score=36.40 gb/GFBE01020569.1/:1-543(+)